MKVVFIGSGNVATHMAKAFSLAGYSVVEVWSPNFDNADLLANAVGAKPIASIAHIDQSADLYIIAVKDEAIAGVVQELTEVNGLVVHTSGTTSIEVLSSLKKYGVLYPLQTFSKSKALDFKRVPLCIEASDEETLQALKVIAGSISEQVFLIESAKRKVLHLSAVFACNFANHLYTIGQELLQHHDLDFAMLRPLILETAEKVQTNLPQHVQTGPAIRNDETTIAAHLELLRNNEEWGNIYQTLSKSIKKTYQ